MPIGLFEGMVLAGLLSAAGIYVKRRMNPQDKVLAELLNAALGRFIEGLDANALSTNLLEGSVELGPLQLKSSAFDGLGCVHSIRAIAPPCRTVQDVL